MRALLTTVAVVRLLSGPALAENKIVVALGYEGAVRVEDSPDYADWDRATMVR
ncbi:hypothetical protein [Pelagibius sp.]|uniref:hypothetical protein n=1 Tax=Pelagibius sp. TaxID=1931238 RepID=UPI003B500D19